MLCPFLQHRPVSHLSTELNWGAGGAFSRLNLTDWSFNEIHQTAACDNKPRLPNISAPKWICFTDHISPPYSKSFPLRPWLKCPWARHLSPNCSPLVNIFTCVPSTWHSADQQFPWSWLYFWVDAECLKENHMKTPSPNVGTDTPLMFPSALWGRAERPRRSGFCVSGHLTCRSLSLSKTCLKSMHDFIL